MRRVTIMVCAGLASWVLAACVPAVIRRSPAVDGTVTLDGIPVVAAPVYVQTDANARCSDSPLRTVTDKRGHFAIPIDRSFELYWLVPLGDRVHSWRLCFEHQGRSILGYHAMSGDIPPKHIGMECELSIKDNSAEGATRSPFFCKQHEP